mmetsp:Transcript_49644/g.142374  ORF Transcript_49644/g.142374 Transcript_49644/m.142374 type:complete len:821 (-) Transcript_49644:115-2577(-)
MEFACAEGACALVDESSAGQRLQAFARRAFREQLGRGGGHLHGSCKHAARDEESRGGLRVNGRPCQGRTVLRAGDLVTLLDTQENGGEATARSACGTGRARMDYGAVARPAAEGEVAEAPPTQQVDFGATSAAEAFGRYYRSQHLCPEEEWTSAEAVFERPLALCLRLNASAPASGLALGELRAHFGARLRRVPWADSAWRLEVSEASTAEGGSGDDGERVTSLLLHAQSCGELALQEAAAMLPALALRPKLGHAVLDLCAAPGGKTLQMLDMMLSSPSSSSSQEGRANDEASGSAHTSEALKTTLLVSNDLERQRQERTLRRSHGLFCAPLVVTCGDASTFRLRVGRQDRPGEEELLRFDRVLCDVPCGGDGTLRKSPDKLLRWTARTGLRNHGTQLRILRNGLELLKPEGLLVYSTCSLDPVQNEAVVRAALEVENQVRGASASAPPRYRLLPPEEALPEVVTKALRFDPGVPTWHVPHPDYVNNGILYSRWSDVPAELRGGCPTVDLAGASPERCGVAAGRRGPRRGGKEEEECRLAASMFPAEPGPGGARASHCPLESCIRLLPTHDDCGGFFVAVLQRCGDGLEEEDVDNGSRCADDRNGLLVETCTWLQPPDDAVRGELVDLFGLGEDARAWSLATTARGAAGQPVLLSLVPALALRLRRPEAALGAAAPSLVGVGLPVFCRMPPGAEWWPPEAPWRICQEGATFLVEAGATRRVLRCPSSQVACELLGRRSTPLARLRELLGPEDLASCGCDDKLVPGAAILALPPLVGVAAAGELQTEAGAPAVAALLDASGLVLLADGDILECYARRYGGC